MKNKTINLFSIFVIVFCLNFAISAQIKKNNPVQKPDPAETSVEKVEEEAKFLKELLADSMSDSRELVAVPPEGKRYIMTVMSHYIVSNSDFIGKPPVVTNEIVIKLTGKASPSSPQDFTTAYLIFHDSPRPLKRPQIVQKGNQKILTIWYPSTYAATIKQVLDGTKPVYCWIGNFGKIDQNYIDIYADVHAEY